MMVGDFDHCCQSPDSGSCAVAGDLQLPGEFSYPHGSLITKTQLTLSAVSNWNHSHFPEIDFPGMLLGIFEFILTKSTLE